MKRPAFRKTGRRAGPWWLAAAGAALVLWGCGPASNPQTFLDSFKPSSDEAARMALGSLAVGDFAKAEGEVETALRRDAKNPYALLAAGLLYQNTARPIKARAMYEELLSLHPAQTVTLPGADSPKPVPIAEVAAANLKRVESASRDGWSAFAGIAAAPAQAAPVPSGRVETAVLSPVGAASAVAERFLVLRRLRDEQLVTPEEYQVRRAANIGALLPMSSRPPAEGLDRPVPAAERIEDRLREMQKALRNHAISAQEYETERGIILDGLLPARPERLAGRETPPADVLAAAARAREIERLRALGLIGDDEAQAERRAVEAALRPAPAPAARPETLVPTSGKSVMVRLASYRTEALAKAGWADLKKRFPAELGRLSPRTRKVKVRDKGTFVRLYAGPLPGRSAAADLCGTLKRKKQFCTVD